MRPLNHPLPSSSRQGGWSRGPPLAAVGSRELERGELQVSFKETGDHRYNEAPFETLPNLNSLNPSLLCIPPIPAFVLLVHVNGDINNRLLFKIYFIGIFSIFSYNFFFHLPLWLENYSYWYMSFIHLTALLDIRLCLHFLILWWTFFVCVPLGTCKRFLWGRDSQNAVPESLTAAALATS